MVETSERQVRAGRDLEALVQQLGDDAVAEGLGVTTGALESLKDAQVEMDDETLENLERMCQVLGNAVGSLDAFGGQAPSIVAVDLDQDGTPDVELSGVGMLTPSVSWTEEQEQKRISLRSARALALITQFRLGMSYQEHFAALGMVTQVELALIAYFRESVPEPGVEWDGERRSREIERRLARLRWVEREQEREYGGLKGVWNWLVGRNRISGKELYQRMLNEADGMLDIMANGSRGEDVMREVMRYGGVDYMNEERGR